MKEMLVLDDYCMYFLLSPLSVSMGDHEQGLGTWSHERRYTGEVWWSWFGYSGRVHHRRGTGLWVHWNHDGYRSQWTRCKGIFC